MLQEEEDSPGLPAGDFDRDAIRAALAGALQDRKDVLAMWEAGSAAFGRVDRYSDLDLGILVEAGAYAAVWSAIDAEIDRLGGVSLRWHEPSPVFAGLDKRTMRLRRADPWLQLDIGLLEATAQELYLQPERHGRAIVLFDKVGRTALPPLDAQALQACLCQELHHQLMKWRLYEGWFRKEAARGRSVDAFRMYLALTLRPLLAVLGMAHRAPRWDFDLRYVHEDFPADVAAAISRLCYVPDPEHLDRRQAEAQELLDRAVAELAERGIVPVDPTGHDVAGPRVPG